MQCLSKAQVLRLHEDIVAVSGGSAGLRDEGALDSALAQPFASFGGQDLYPTLIDKAAALGFSLINNHPFIDGNKRTALAASVTFLEWNNRIFSPFNEDVVFDFMKDLAIKDGNPSTIISGEMVKAAVLESQLLVAEWCQKGTFIRFFLFIVGDAPPISVGGEVTGKLDSLLKNRLSSTLSAAAIKKECSPLHVCE